jgi:hypothetical protein
MIGAPGPLDRHGDEERRLRQFEAEWKAGAPPELAAYLPKLSPRWQDDPAQRDLIVELIAIDLEYRCRQKSPVSLEDYCRRHALGSAATLPLELIAAEYEARCLAGAPPDFEAFVARFPGRAETLRPLLVKRYKESIPIAETDDDTATLAVTFADAPPIAIASVLQALEIVEPEHRETLSHAVHSGAYATATDLLAFAVGQAWLTRFQAEQLLAGRGEQLVQGPYVLLDEIGEGGMSKVFLARHRLLHRHVAYKVIRRAFIAEAGDVAVQRFYQEMQAVGRLSHPNLIHAYDAGPVGGTHFLAMEYVDGIDLGRLLRERGPLPVAEVCNYIYQVALGLQHVFECGLVHRDLKPSNLLLSRDTRGGSAGTVKILDLGLASLSWSEGARSRTALTGAHTFLGTPDYIAPEQALEPKTADIRADLYSLGCTFYQLLTGSPPFPGGAIAQKLQRHFDETPPSLTAARPDVPANVAAIVHRLLAKRAEDRFQTPHELAHALASSSLPRPAGRRKLRIWIAAAVFLMVITGVASLAAYAWRPRARPVAAPVDPLDAALNALRGHEPTSDAERERLRRELREFHAQHAGTRQGDEAALAARRLPSAFDRLYPVGTGETKGLVGVFQAHDCPVYGVAVSPDGTTVATSGSADPVIKLWELRAGKFQLREKIPGHTAGVHSVRFAPDGRSLLSTSFDGTARLWDLGPSTPRARHVFPEVPGCVETAIYALDGRSLLVGRGDGSTRVCPTSNPAASPALLGGNISGIEILAFNLDGSLLAVGGGAVRLWGMDSRGKQDRGTFQGTSTIFSLGFSPDNRLLAAGGVDGSIHVWDVGRSAPPRVIREHTGPVITTLFSADGKWFYSAANDCRIVRWRLPAWTKHEEWRLPANIHRTDFAPDGRHLLTANNDGTMFVMRVEGREPPGN